MSQLSRTIQSYVTKMEVWLIQNGDQPIDQGAIYGGKTIKEEIKLAKERLERLKNASHT